MRRSTTNTPLQALVLWNDEQFVEAARVLAQRTLAEGGDDGARLARMFRSCTGRSAGSGRGRDADAGARRIPGALPQGARRRREARGVGTASRPAEPGAAELAAWTLVASAVLDLDATTTRN